MGAIDSIRNNLQKHKEKMEKNMEYEEYEGKIVEGNIEITVPEDLAEQFRSNVGQKVVLKVFKPEERKVEITERELREYTQKAINETGYEKHIIDKMVEEIFGRE